MSAPELKKRRGPVGRGARRLYQGSAKRATLPFAAAYFDGSTGWPSSVIDSRPALLPTVTFKGRFARHFFMSPARTRPENTSFTVLAAHAEPAILRDAQRD